MSDARRANLAAVVVILLAGGLSTIWAFLVPIFQAPDEPAHFDYAASIYGAHRLIRLSDGKADWIVSPYTKYLLTAVDFSRIAMNSSMRVPTGYGTRQYFAKLDAGSPSLAQPIEPQGKINYIVPAYPFGFYALEAVWMHLASLFTGSLATVFFAARLLCVFLLMAGLYFNYRTALNLGVPHWVAVALVAAIGFFPMTSFVSSYVQPDNLAYALVSASLFFATCLRSDALRAATLVSLSLSLALLAITKYQCFLVVALPILPLVALRLSQSGMSRKRALASVAGLFVPTFVLLAAQHWIVGQSNPGGGSNIAGGIGLDHFRSVAALGVSATLSYVVVSASAAFIDFFVSGPCAATFWQVFGWGDTPIFIVDGSVELWIRAAIAVLTVAVAGAVAIVLARNASRIGGAWQRGHKRLAIDALVSDPVFSSYALFVGLMFALYVLTNNVFGAEGRHWYPFIFPAFLCFVWYAPRLVRTQSHVPSAVLTGALFMYAVVAAGYALTDVAQRYYGAQTSRFAALDPLPRDDSEATAGTLWVVKSAEYHLSDRSVPAFRKGSSLMVGGAALPSVQTRSSVVAATVDGRPIPVLAGEYQFAVAEATRNLLYAYSQFYAQFSTRRLSEGAHIVAAYALVSDQRRFGRIGVTRTFFLTGSDGRFSPVFLRALGSAPLVPGRVENAGACKGFSFRAGGGQALDAGGIALLAGQIGESRLDPYRAVWLLADGRPYQARYDEQTRAFTATIPTAGFALGAHRVVAYAITDRPGHPVQIAQGATLYIKPGHGASEYLAHPPPACSDSLHQLAGPST